MIERHIETWYEMALRTLRLDFEVPDATSISSLVFLGLGGSGIVGDYIRTLAHDRLDVPLHVVKEARLPRWVGRGAFVIAISYSGNTLETIEATQIAFKRGSKVYVISSNGILINYAHQKGIPYIKLDEGYAPRAAMPLMLYPCLRLLNLMGFPIAGDDEIVESMEVLKEVEENRGVAEKLALNLTGEEMPTIIADSRFEALALRFKNDLNENAKMSAKCDIIPESMHNDIVGYERGVCPRKALILDADDNHFYTHLIKEFVADILNKFQVKTLMLRLKGRGMLTKLMYGSHISGLMSIAIARMRNIDPEATISISKYKIKLEEILKRATR